MHPSRREKGKARNSYLSVNVSRTPSLHYISLLARQQRGTACGRNVSSRGPDVCLSGPAARGRDRRAATQPALSEQHRVCWDSTRYVGVHGTGQYQCYQGTALCIVAVHCVPGVPGVPASTSSTQEQVVEAGCIGTRL